MNLFNFLISANIVISICWLITYVLMRINLLTPKNQLVFVKFLIGFIFLIPLIFFIAPKTSFTVTSAQVWSAPSKKPSLTRQLSNKMHISSYSNEGSVYSIPLADSQKILLLPLFIGMLIIFLQSLVDGLKLRNILKGAHLLRKIGKVQIYVSDEINIPCAHWFFPTSRVILPSSIIFQPKNMKLAIFHELQHHRQKDTRMVYLLAILKSLFLFNPFFHLWEKQLNEIQELACDEAVLSRKKISAKVYGNCLIKMAQSLLKNQRPLFGTTSMAANSSKHKLTRRLEMLFVKPKEKRTLSYLMIVLSLTSLSIVALASKDLIKDRRVKMTEALHYQSLAQEQTSFPIDVNPAVLKQLNRFLGTPDGRHFIRESLKRMKTYQTMMQEKSAQYSVPSEILALPIIESGYRNLSPSYNKNKSAGLWQFIPSTAKNFGLTVNGSIDERLHEEKETSAAMQYLSKNNLLFQDWRLALMAYNMGEFAVFRAIRKTNTRDPWELIERGFEGDKDYLAKFMAAVLIMKNPSILK